MSKQLCPSSPDFTQSDEPSTVGESLTMDADNSGREFYENQKLSKPVMEKRRRTRINNTLNELKAILLKFYQNDNIRHSKLEKADILEMTVKHLRRLEKQGLSGKILNNDYNVFTKYVAGFNECRNEVVKFLSTCDGIAVEVRTHLLNHLSTCHQALKAGNLQTLNNDDLPGEVVMVQLQPVSASKDQQYQKNDIEEPVTMISSDRTTSRVHVISEIPKSTTRYYYKDRGVMAENSVYRPRARGPAAGSSHLNDRLDYTSPQDYDIHVPNEIGTYNETDDLITKGSNYYDINGKRQTSDDRFEELNFVPVLVPNASRSKSIYYLDNSLEEERKLQNYETTALLTGQNATDKTGVLTKSTDKDFNNDHILPEYSAIEPLQDVTRIQQEITDRINEPGEKNHWRPW